MPDGSVDDRGDDRRDKEAVELADRVRLQTQIVDAVSEGVLVVRAADLGVIHCNRSWLQIFGAADQAATGFPEFSPGGEDTSQVRQEIRRSLERHGKWRTEAHIRRADGSSFSGRLTVTVAHHRVHRAVWIVLCDDVSAEHAATADVEEALREERRSADDLRRADSDKDQFLAVVSEELNKPVAALIGHVDLLRDRLHRLSPEVVAKSLEQMAISINGIASLADRLLYVLRLESGLERIEPVRLHLAMEVQGRLGALEHLLREREVTVDVPADLVVVVDPDAIGRILGGLLTNAVKYSEPGSEVNVRASTIGPGWARVEVQDHGRGMPRSRLESLLEESPEGWRRGTGLGIRIIHQFIRLHGGMLGAESVEGEGTTIWFTLPAAAAGQQSAGGDRPSP